MHTYTVSIGEKEYSVKLDADGSVRVNGEQINADVRRLGDRSYSVLLGKKSIRIVGEKTTGGFRVLIDGVHADIGIESERLKALKKFDHQSGAGQSRMEILAPMPALVVKVEVREGEEVVKGQGLMILEAMKMENELKAHQPGRVKEIRVEKGKSVEKGQVLIILE